MADVVALCKAFTRLGFSAKAAGFITDDQVLDTLDELKVLTNDEIESLCKVVWRPGGTVPNPNYGDPEQPANMLSPGEQVLLQAQLNLKLACYYLWFKEKTIRLVGSTDIKLVNVRELRNHIDWESLTRMWMPRS